MNKKQKQNIKKLLKMLPIAIMLAIIVTIGMFLNAYALDINISADVADPDCYWSNGPGTELYVASGKTCTITSNTMAFDGPTWTDYAVIVYSGGTLNIINNDSSNVKLDVFGDIYNMGTINIGNGTSFDFNATITTSSGISPGDIYVMGASGVFNVTANAGVGQNSFSVFNDMHIGDAGNSSAATLNINDNNTSNIVTEVLTSFDTVNINAGTLTVGNLRVTTPNTGSSNMTIADGAEVALHATATTFSACLIDGQAKNCSLEVGVNTAVTGTGAILTVNGTLTVPLYAANDVSVKIGGGDGTGTLSVGTTGTVDINETGDFATPGDPTTEPDNSFYIASESPAGLITAGVTDSEMFVWNQGGDINVSSATTTGKLNARNHYRQNSGLNVASGDTMIVTGEADVDGDSTINGTLETTQCMKITNSATEDFTVGTVANVDINTDNDTTCALVSGVDDGLNIQGPFTTFSIADGVGRDLDIWQDFTVDDGAYADMNADFTVNGPIKIIGDATRMDLTDSASDTTTATQLTIASEVATPTAPPILNIESGGLLYLSEGSVNIGGLIATTATAFVDVAGTLSINPAATSAGFDITRYGHLYIQNGGTVNADGNGGGGSYFFVWGGELDVYGTLNMHATNDMEMWIANNTDIARVHVYSTGLIDSKATPASNVGLNYTSGNLTIDNGGQMLFDDEIDIDTADLMTIDGLLEGTDQIDFNGTVGSHMVGPSGEMKVVGLTDYKLIDIHQNLGVLGKLNGDDGNGDIYISGTGTEVGGVGETGKNSYTYLLARDLFIFTGASIDVSNYVNCYNPGGQTYGGSYGGEGAGGSTTTFGGAKYITAPIYDTKPNPVGMFGFDNGGGSTVYCGGAVYIEVHRDIQINGAILANGSDNGADTQGAGSGGLIMINHNIAHSDTAADFTGSSNIEANGGNSTGTINSYGGGGGRIVIDSILFEEPDDDETGEPHYQYTGGVYALGGQSNNTLVDGFAASGTIAYLGDDNSPNGTLISDAGNRPPETGKETLIPVFGPGGNIIFDRMHARDGADILYAVDPLTDPIGCYVSGTGSSINLTGGSCVQNADKPDTMHINTSFNGAQTGDEPWTDDGASTTVTLNDHDPVFSVVMRNPELTAYEFTQVEFEINSDPGFGAGTMMWESGDTNNPYVLTNTVHDGERTEDIEYAGDPLAASTTYYVRARLLHDFSGPGLWTHMGMGNEYKFTTTAAYYDIDNSCSDLIIITQSGLPGGDPVKTTASGKRYGYGSCTFTIDTSTNANWEVLYGMSPNSGGFVTGGGTPLTPINNPTDYTIDTSGATSAEEYGFNISLPDQIGLTNSNVMDDGNWDFNNAIKFFNIESNTAEDAILEDTASAISTDDFDLTVHLNVSDYTEPEDYSLETWMILTDGP